MHFSIYVISHSSTGGSLNCEALIHVKEDFVEEIRRSNFSVVQESCKNIIIIAFPIVIYINLFLGISICFWAYQSVSGLIAYISICLYINCLYICFWAYFFIAYISNYQLFICQSVSGNTYQFFALLLIYQLFSS